MARRPKPWYYIDRGTYCVWINGIRHNLGPDKQRAYAQFHKLMSQPRRQIKVTGDSLSTRTAVFVRSLINAEVTPKECCLSTQSGEPRGL